MTPLNLIRLPLDLPALNIFAQHREMVRNGVLDEGAVLHHLLGESFGPGALQPFRMLVARGARSGMLYAYTRQRGDSLQEMAQTVALPEALQVLKLAQLADKPLPDSLFKTGKRLGFDIVIRPVVRIRKTSPLAKAGAERDAYEVAAHRLFPDTRGEMSAKGPSRQMVYTDWLASRLGSAADLDKTTKLAAFQRVRTLRGGQVVEGPRATLHGTLTITDPEAFRDLLEKGVGRHRNYGYGMLMLRPPQRC